MKSLKWLLFPFSLIYHTITSIRNWCFDVGYFNSYIPPVKTICVGNLSVGGTGKSPMIEYLIRQYSKTHTIAVLSRGYKRKTKVCVEVLPDMPVEQVGDEPLQFKRKFEEIKVFVEANRKEGIKTILNTYPETNLILLDDAYQHRKVKAHKYILLTTYQNPYFRDFILPVGWLRESRSGAKRADVIIVTKCPDTLNPGNKKEYINHINPTKNQQVLYSKIKYSNHIHSTQKTVKLSEFDDFYLVTGIAKPKPMLDFLKRKNKTFKHLAYPDHHNFTKEELSKLRALEKPILTTEKDFMRLSGNLKEDLYYLPIEVELDKKIVKFI